MKNRTEIYRTKGLQLMEVGCGAIYPGLKIDKHMDSRRTIGIWFLLILGLAIGLVIENVRAGLLIGLIIGLCTMGLVAGKRGKGEK